MLEFLINLVLVSGIAMLFAGLVVAGYYARLGMANRNFLWTIAEEGWYKIVMRQGKYHCTLGPGLHWLGWPGVYTLYSRKMVFKKCKINDDGSFAVEDHIDPDINSFKNTIYPYAIPFKDEADSHGLPLTGVIALHGRTKDPYKQFFTASDWFMTMGTLSVSGLRQVLTEVSWEQVTGQNLTKKTAAKVFGELLWEAMQRPREGGKPSVIDELNNTYGIEIESVELLSIDPPAGWRDTTLAPYKARKEKEAAVQKAQASAIEFDDTNQALQKWLETHPRATQAQINAKQEELRERALAKTQGYRQVQIKGLENATTAVVDGVGIGGTGFLIGSDRGGRGNRGDRGNRSERGRGKKVADMADDELDDLEKDLDAAE